MPRRDKDFDDWLDKRRQEPPEQTPLEVEAEEYWIKRIHDNLKLKPKETTPCLPRKSR